MDCKKIQITKKQAEAIYDDCILITGKTTEEDFLIQLRNNGYLKKTAVEEFEELYQKLAIRNLNMRETDLALRLAYEAIQELKAQLEAGE